MLKKLTNRVDDALKTAGLTWMDLSARAEQIILFGSTAVGCDRPDSDVDLLCVGEGKDLDTGRLHLLWIKNQCFRDPLWLGSEIGTHVAQYGVWLKGKPTFAASSAPHPRALERKRERIFRRAHALLRNWAALSPRFRAAQRRKLRLDVQRLELLQRGLAVKPNPLLDQNWRNKRNRVKWLKAVLSGEGDLWRVVESVMKMPLGNRLPRFEHLQEPSCG